MNTLSIILILIIAAAFIAVAVRLCRKGPGCNCTTCDGCPCKCKRTPTAPSGHLPKPLSGSATSPLLGKGPAANSGEEYLRAKK